VAREHYQEAREIALDLDNLQLLAGVHVGLGHVALHSGDHMDARHYYTESLAHYRQAGNQPVVAKILAGLGLVALTQGDYAQSRQYFLESLQAGIATGSPPVVLNTMTGIVELFMLQGNFTQAVPLAAHVARHPASCAEAKDRARQVLIQSEAEWPTVDFGMAMHESRQTDLSIVAAQLVDQLAAHIQQPLVEPLSERELEVLQLVAIGRSNREIAQDLTLALGTVKTHLHSILQKLDTGNRTEAVARARELHLL
jgi:DNA-binding CsgD family transcriptional regulator